MTTASLPPNKPVFSVRRLWERRQNAILTSIAALVFVIVSNMILEGRGDPDIRFRIDLAPLAVAPPVLQVHIAAAVSSFLIGCALLLGVKGRTFHRVFGYTWVATMLTTAISSLFLTGLNGDAYSPIHLLSGLTIVAVPMGLAAARRRKIADHRKRMTGTFVSGMLIAGLFTFLPGRLMWDLFFAL